MKKKLIFIVVIVFMSISLYSQNKDLSSIYTLKRSPDISDENKILIILNELISYGSAFKFADDILKGNFVIEREKERFLIRIIDKEHKSKDKAVLVFTRTMNSDQQDGKAVNFGIENIQSLLNEHALNSISNNSNFSYPNLSYRNNVFIDKKILVESIPGGVNNRIVNRSITRQYLIQQSNSQPASVFLIATDGVIVPVGSGFQEKLFIVDNLWDRIMFADKNFNPPSGYSPFYRYGLHGNGNGQFIHPSGITYGSLDGQNYRKIFVADNGNNRIHDLRYKLQSWGWEWYLGPNTILRSQLSQPFDIAHHSGYLPDWMSTNDNVIWISEQGIEPGIRCINVLDGLDKFHFNIFEFSGNFYKVNPGRLDTYVEYNSNNQPIRAMLAYVDLGLNAVVFFQLDYNGFSFSTNPPKAFCVQQYPLTERISTVKFVTNLPGSIHPTGVLVTTNDQSQNGHLHINKVRNRVNPQTGQFTIPFTVEYIVSTSKLSVDNIYSSDFKNIFNLESQYNHVDIFSLENWDNDHGIRRFKPGVDLNNLVQSNYCNGIYRCYWNFKLSNPCKTVFSARFKYANQSTWNPIQISMYGIYFSNQEFSLDNGQLQIPIDLHFGSNDNPPAPGDQVEITAKFFPLDESLNSTNYTAYTRISNAVDCNSGGGCPYVYVYNGSEFIQDNNILHRSEFENNLGRDIEDKHLLKVSPFFNVSDSTQVLKIKELNNDISNFDKFSLVAIDHPIDTKLGVTETNNYVLYFPFFVADPEHAELNGNDVTDVLYFDTNYIKKLHGDNGDLIIGTFPTYGSVGMNKSVKNKFLEYLNGFNHLSTKKNQGTLKSKNIQIHTDNLLTDSVAVFMDPSADVIPIGNPAKRPAGNIVAFDSEDEYVSPEMQFSRRQNSSPVFVTVGDGNINIDSIVDGWTSDFMISYLVIMPVFYGGFIENNLNLIEASDSLNGDVLSYLTDIDENYAVMDSTTNITLKFKNALGQPPTGFIRDYVLVTNGRYENVREEDLLRNEPNNTRIPATFNLYQNFPNPFNPITKIKFDLPNEEIVSIKIYNVLGKEVYSLREIRQAGFHQISFDGSNYASGVYFYKIEAGHFIQTKRMVLIK